MNLFKVRYSEEYHPEEWEYLYGSHLRSYAARNFKGLVAILYFLLKEEGQRFDCILAAGDSGLAMAQFVELIYNVLDSPVPKKVVLPIKRYKDPEMLWSDNPKDFHDNSVLLPQLKRHLNEISHIKSILYIDDEISILGISVKACISLLLKVLPQEQKPTVTIVAENQGLQWKTTDPDVNVNFYSFCTSVDNLYGVIFYLLPASLREKFAELPELNRDIKFVVNILLGLPIKKADNNKQEFSFEVYEMVKQKIPDLEQLQKQFRDYLDSLIAQGIDEYKQKKIEVLKNKASANNSIEKSTEACDDSTLHKT